MTELSVFDLSKRTNNIANKNGIITLKDLTNCKKPDMSRMFGMGGCTELYDLLESLGLASWQMRF